MRKITYVVMLVTLAVFVATSAFALPSSKFAAHVKDLVIVEDATSQAWTTVLTADIKTPNKKDLLIGASFETGIYTRTKVKGKGGDPLTASAEGNLQIRVLIDGVTTKVLPKEVTYDYRKQTLNAVLGGVIEQCTCVVDPLTGTCTIIVADNCDVTDEEIELILDTMAAHHFNFVAKDLTSGEHTVEVQISISSDTNGDATATVTVGNGSLTVEEVRAINQDGGIVFEMD
jgi:hypothetical protein